MAIGGINLGQELLNVPMGQMIESMAMAIAQAQWSLDKSSMTVAEMMSGRRVLRDLDTGKLIGKTTIVDGKVQETTEPQVLDSRVYFGYSYELDKDNKPIRTPQLLSMMELGFTPTFYQFVDTIIEVKIAISVKSETQYTNDSSQKVNTTTDTKSSNYDYQYRGYNWGWGWGGHSSSGQTNSHSVATSQVNASYANKYGYSADGASLLRTKLVPVPPPAILEERIHEIMRIEKAYEQWNLLTLRQNQIEADTTKSADDKKREKAALETRKQAVMDTMVGVSSEN